MQVFINTGPKIKITGGFGGMLPRENVDCSDLHLWILRCFEAHWITI